MRHRYLALVLAALLAGVSCSRDPEVVKRKYVETGNKYFDAGKYKEASLMYRKALQKDMRYGEAYYRLALADLKLNRLQEAVRALRRSVELDPQNADAHAILADIYLSVFVNDPNRSKGLLGEVKELADSLLKRDPKSFQGLRLTGYLEITSKNLPAAIAKFREANDVRPLEPNVVLPLSQTLTAANQFEEGEKLALALIDKHKNFGPIYDFLYREYTRRNRVDEAERLLQNKIANNPKEAGFVLQLAGHYFNFRKRPEMLSTLQRVLANSKEWPSARVYVGDFYFRLNEMDNAIEQYQAGAREMPKDKANYQKKIVEALIMQRKLGEASQVVEALIKDNPKDPDALAMRASLTLQSGDRTQLQTAINDLQAALTKAPSNPVLRFNLGRAYLAKNDPDQARQQFREAVKLRPDYLPPQIALATMDLSKGDFGKAQQAADEILKLDPNNVVAKLVRASALMGSGERQRARAEVQEILKANPNLNDARMQLAMLEFGAKNYPEAEREFRRLYEGTPPDPRGIMGLTEVYMAQNKAEQALRLMQEEVKKAPDRADYRTAMANIAVRSQKFDLAIEEYQRLISQNPLSADLHLKLAETYRLKGDTEAAIKLFKKARELAPTDIAPLMQLALVYERAYRPAEARPIYEQVLRIQPDHAIALNNLAYAMAEMGTDLDLALTYAQRAKQKLPQEPNVSDTLGWIYIKKNLSDNAIGIFRELIANHPENSTFHYHLGMALFQKGDKPGAKKMLQVALRKKPSKEEESKIKELLGKIG